MEEEPVIIDNINNDTIEISVENAKHAFKVSPLSQVKIEDSMYEIIEKDDTEIPPVATNIMSPLPIQKNKPHRFKQAKNRKTLYCLLTPCFCLSCIITNTTFYLNKAKSCLFKNNK